MGTRADFYVGTGKEAQWLGSLAFDGYRINDMTEQDAVLKDDYRACYDIKTATNEKAFREAVTLLLHVNGDATVPEQGWPWPWDDSQTTDYAYCFDGTKTRTYSFGREITGLKDGDEAPKTKSEFPNMKDVKNVTLGKRSGLVVLGV